MSASINWALLETQYFSDKVYQNDLAKMVKIIDRDVSISLRRNIFVRVSLISVKYMFLGCFLSWSTLRKALSCKYEQSRQVKKRIQ